VNALLLFLGTALAADADPELQTQNTYFSAQSYFDAPVIAQSAGTYDDDPLRASPGGQTFAPGPASPYSYDPSLGAPPGGDFGYLLDPGLSFGAVGPQPYRFGWTSRYDIGYLPNEGVHGGGASGEFGVMEVNAAMRYTTGWPAGLPNWIFSWTPEFNYRSWSGPTNPPLPPNVYRFASDFELATPGNNPVSMQLGFTPAFVSDFIASPSSDAFNYDVRGVVFLRTSPQLMVALGAAYWHRVDDIVIPYAGVVWTPDEYWEFRLMFPKTRISYFLGNWWGGSAWAYAAVEYNVEAYQINMHVPANIDEKIQIRDYRAVVGLRSEGGGVTGFVEAGWVFARAAEFLHGTPGFDINTGFIGRLGLRF
jgi:hypothetical protein